MNNRKLNSIKKYKGDYIVYIQFFKIFIPILVPGI